VKPVGCIIVEGHAPAAPSSSLTSLLGEIWKNLKTAGKLKRSENWSHCAVVIYPRLLENP